MRDALRATRREPAPAHVIEWLDSSHPSSPRILFVQHVPDARELRERGFVAIRLSLLMDPALNGVWPLLHGRSIVLLDAAHEPDALALALLKLRRADVRDSCTLSLLVSSAAAVQKVAESRAAYEARPPHDARPGAMFTEGERLLAGGRHAAADRILRAAIGAFDRRGDTLQAARSELTLGRMLLTRGRAADAVASFERAHDRFQRARAPGPAISAMIHLGIAPSTTACPQPVAQVRSVT